MWKTTICLVAVFAIGSSVGASRAIAQECTVKCQCFSSGCGCQSSGGNGCKCDASGGGCFVTQCGSEACNITEESAPVIAFAPDGTPVRANPTQVAMAGRSGSFGLGVALGDIQSPGVFRGWERIAPGHAVQRNCQGLVLRRAFGSMQIAAVRASTERIRL